MPVDPIIADLQNRIKRLESANAVDSDLETYITLAAAQGSFFDTPERNLILNFIRGLKQDGIWNLILDGCFFMGQGLTGGLVKFKTASGAGTSLGNPTAGSAITSAEFTQVNGIIPVGTTKYLKTGFIPNNYAATISNTNFGITIAISKDYVPDGTARTLWGVVNSNTLTGSTVKMSARGTDATTKRKIEVTNSNLINSFTVPSLQGCFTWSFTPYGTFTYQNGEAAGLFNRTVNPTGLPPLEIYLLSLNSDSSRLETLPCGISFYCFHQALTQIQANQLYTKIKTLNDALGRPTLTPTISTPSSNLNMVVVTGQSLAFGSAATPALSTTQPYSNLMLNVGIDAMGGTSGEVKTQNNSLVPLLETAKETLGAGFANRLSSVVSGGYDSLVAVGALPSQPYSVIKKQQVQNNPLGQVYFTGQTYLNGAKNCAALLSPARPVKVRALFLVHGEADTNLGTSAATYEGYLKQLQSDFELDVQTKIDSTLKVPLFACQTHSWGMFNSTVPTCTLGQYRAMINNPGKIYCVGPKYFLPYAGDGIHLSNIGQRWNGEYYSKAYKSVVVDGNSNWTPLMPSAITKSGTTITLTIKGNVGNLVLDTTLVSNPGSTGGTTNVYGFEVVDSTNTLLTISSVTITGTNTIQIVVASGTPARLRYAYTTTFNAFAGATTGPRGNIRDSDSAASLYGNTLYNWLITFDEAIN